MKPKSPRQRFSFNNQKSTINNASQLLRGCAPQARFGTGLVAGGCKNADFRIWEWQNPRKIRCFPQADGYKIASIGMKLIFFEEEVWLQA